MTEQKVIVSYTSSPHYLASDTWKQTYTALLAQLPLRNIHWKSPARPALRTIQELDIALVPLDSVRDDHTSQIPSLLLEKPFLNIYVTACEDSDIYKSSVRKQIKDWHSSVTQRKNQEWLIVHVVNPDLKAGGGGFLKMNRSVLDKIKTDFNTDKKDRCVQLAWSSTMDTPAAWAETLSKIKDGVLTSFDIAVSQREEDIKRSESQRAMPGWNFCTFFILKESLASSFAGVHLLEDALIQYDELEASFFQAIQEKNLSWFGTLISPTPKDDTLPLLSITKKPYRDLILANTISIFDFRTYLLAQQCNILGGMGRVIELGRKASTFLVDFGRRLKDIEDELPPHFVESWIYSSALSVVDHCDRLSASRNYEGIDVPVLCATKGQLLELARDQLDTIGIRLGYLPDQIPFNLNSSSASKSVENSSGTISNSDLLSILRDETAFYDLYVKITNRAIEMYTKAGRRKFALKMHGNLAALDLHRSRLPAALQTYTSLPAHYAPHGWTALESFMLSKAIGTHEQSGKAKNAEWINILLNFLKTFVDEFQEGLIMADEDKAEHASNLVLKLQKASEELSEDLVYSDHTALSIRVGSNARHAGERDGSLLDVVVSNKLPCVMAFENIEVVLVGGDGEKLFYSASLSELNPNDNTLTLLCATSPPGTYYVESSELRSSHLRMQWSYPKPVWKNSTFAYGLKHKSTLVRILKDPRAFDVDLCQCEKVDLGQPSKLSMYVKSGRNHVSKASIKLSESSDVKFVLSDATVDNDISIESSNDTLTLLDISPDSTVSVFIPYTNITTNRQLRIRLDAEYFVTAEASLSRSIHLLKVVSVDLPISVNVQDYFRGTRLFSRFTVATTTNQSVLVASAHLEAPVDNDTSVKITGCRPDKQHSTISVTPSLPANFLFHVDSKNGPVRDPLRFRVKYRLLREEIEALLRHALASMEVADVDETLAAIRIALGKNSAWIDHYLVTGQLKIASDVSDAHEDIINALPKYSSRDLELSIGWNELSIPVDVPLMEIVVGAHIQITPPHPSSQPPAIYAGQPIAATLSMHTSFHWSSTDRDSKKTLAMHFDIGGMTQDWLISGCKRGDFEAKDGGVFSVSITLVALRHGQMSLPQVAVTPFPQDGVVTMGSIATPSTITHQVHGAERVLVLPRGGRSTFVVNLGNDHE